MVEEFINRPGNLRYFPSSRNTAFNILSVTSQHSNCAGVWGCKTFRCNQRHLVSKGSVQGKSCVEHAHFLIIKKAFSYSVAKTIDTSTHTRLQVVRFQKRLLVIITKFTALSNSTLLHPITLRAAHLRCHRIQFQFMGKIACLRRRVTAFVIYQPLHILGGCCWSRSDSRRLSSSSRRPSRNRCTWSLLPSLSPPGQNKPAQKRLAHTYRCQN